MKKKIVAVLMTVMMLLSTMAVFVSAGSVNGVSKVQALLNKNYPNISYLVTTGVTSSIKVQCSKDGCTNTDYTQKMFYCNMCKNYFCPDHIIDHLTNDHKIVATVCSVKDCKFDSGFVYCNYCKEYFCLDHYIAQGHVFHQTNGQTNYCSIHKIPYAKCEICGLSYCVLCNPNHSISHSTVTEPTYVCAIGGCGITTNLRYCSLHGRWFCQNHFISEGHASHGSGTTLNYCSIHNMYYVKCSLCGQTYCPKCTTHVCNSSTPTLFYPIASTPSGNVSAGTKISFNKNSAYSIFYTTDGSNPTRNSKLYVSPITIDKDTVIKAVAMRISNFAMSQVVTYDYKVVANIQFTDVSSVKGLEDALNKLVGISAVKNETKFNPQSGFTFAELKTALTALGVDMTKLKLDKKYYSENGEMTYQEFAYVTYKALKFDNVITNAKNGSKTLKTLKYNAELPKASIIKASFASLIENEMCYRLDFKPADKCTRAFMAMSLGTAYDIINAK